MMLHAPKTTAQYMIMSNLSVKNSKIERLFGPSTFWSCLVALAGNVSVKNSAVGEVAGSANTNTYRKTARNAKYSTKANMSVVVIAMMHRFSQCEEMMVVAVSVDLL
jgi:hypothetical protein